MPHILSDTKNFFFRCTQYVEFPVKTTWRMVFDMYLKKQWWAHPQKATNPPSLRVSSKRSRFVNWLRLRNREQGQSILLELRGLSFCSQCFGILGGLHFSDWPTTRMVTIRHGNVPMSLSSSILHSHSLPCLQWLYEDMTPIQLPGLHHSWEIRVNSSTDS